MFISSSPDWSVRHTRPGPGGYGSTTWTVRRLVDGDFRSWAIRRSRTDRPRGPAPTTATAGGPVDVLLDVLLDVLAVVLLFTGVLRSTVQGKREEGRGR
ncbi:hypothetical protein SCWH03_19780 [Streptomyces pacificus]|uniref:Uncharacterized protein n=1 Tax=Streptomyces pacificus TaxID=2705029 RepID=A0A6A0AS55_9ACTN|nr:hypothetical protein SCWH03_19780 [Streptomyces pacificus]